MTRTLVALFMIALVAGCGPDQQSADVVYTNGRIYTVNEAKPWAAAVAIKDGKFIGVGSNEELKRFVGESTKVIDLV